MMRAYAAGDLSKASKYAEKCLEHNENDIGILWTMADCLFQQKKYGESIKYGEKALSVDLRHIDTLQLMTEAHFYQKDYASAYEYACKSISLAESFDDALGLYVDKLKSQLATAKNVSFPRKMKNVLEDETQKTREWISWAIQFKAWYESTQSGSVHSTHRLH